MIAPMPNDEMGRLRALSQYEVLDTPEEKEFNDLARMACFICGTPMAAISLIDEKRQWFKSKIGFNLPETSRADSFCSHTIMSSEVFIVQNAFEDLRFKNNPMVSKAPNLRFYAGVALHSHQNFRIGTLCVLDKEPRQLGKEQIESLQALAIQVQNLLELKRLKLELEAANQELGIAFSGLVRAHSRYTSQQEQLVHSEKMVVLGEMASSIIHEINNPLSVMKLKTELVKSLTLSSEIDEQGLKQFFDQIENGITKISKIIKSTRSFARLSYQEPFQLKDLRVILTDVLELSKKTMEMAQMELRLSGHENELFFECRDSQICQVLVNLLNNSMDAISDLAEKWIHLEVKCSTGQVEISVTDSGNGIPVEVRKEIFQPMFTTKSLGKGTGLGLYISKKIIKSHAGSLELDELSQNTRFVIKLPVIQPSKSAE